MSVVAHFFMSVGGSEIHERLAHFFIDFYMLRQRPRQDHPLLLAAGEGGSCDICYTGKGPRITGLAGGKKAAPSIGKRGLTAQGNLPRRIRRLEAGFRQGAFFGRYPSAPHTAGLLAYASKKPRLLTFAMAYCGSLDDYSDRIARDSHPIPYSPSPVGKGTARGYSI